MFCKNIEFPLEISLQFKLQLEALQNKKEQKLKRLAGEESFLAKQKQLYSSKIYQLFFTEKFLKRKKSWLDQLERSINETKAFINNIEEEIARIEKELLK